MDESVQAQLRALCASPHATDEELRRTGGVMAIAEKLLRDVGEDELGRQLIFHFATSPRESRVYLTWLVRLARAISRFSPASAAIAAEPYLDAKETNLREAARWLLRQGEVLMATSDNGERTFEYVRDFLMRHGNPLVDPNRDPGLWLTSEMFRIDPDAAVRTFYQAPPGRVGKTKSPDLIIAQARVEYELRLRRERVFTENQPLLPQTVEALSTLSESEHWWARLYAAVVMAGNREMRHRDVIDRLAQDMHPLINGAVLDIATGERRQRPETPIQPELNR